MKKDYYRILGVARTATLDEIKKAYRRLALRYHPDVQPKDPHAAEKFHDIAEAYATLSDTDKRAAHDRDLRTIRPPQRSTTTPASSAHAGGKPVYTAYTPEAGRIYEEQVEDFQPVDTTVDRRDVLASLPLLVVGLLIACCLFSSLAATGVLGGSTLFEQAQENVRRARTATQVSRIQAQLLTTRAPDSFRLAVTPHPATTVTALSVAEQNRLAARDTLTCTLDLSGGSHDCQTLEAIRFDSSLSQRRLRLQINLDPAQYSAVAFEITYVGNPTGWTVNIGDSLSNAGSGGDAGHQSNNAELSINEGDLSIYGNEQTPGTSALLFHAGQFVRANSTVTIEVTNQTVRWGYDSLSQQISSAYLYALNGQPDSRGLSNNTIYASFNRVIDNNKVRNGSGVSRIVIKLFPFSQTQG